MKHLTFVLLTLICFSAQAELSEKCQNILNQNVDRYAVAVNKTDSLFKHKLISAEATALIFRQIQLIRANTIDTCVSEFKKSISNTFNEEANKQIVRYQDIQ